MQQIPVLGLGWTSEGAMPAVEDRLFGARRNQLSLDNMWASLVAQLVKNLPAMQETPVRFLGWEDPLEKGQGYPFQYSWASLVAQLIKNPLTMQETWVGKIP